MLSRFAGEDVTKSHISTIGMDIKTSVLRKGIGFIGCNEIRAQQNGC